MPHLPVKQFAVLLLTAVLTLCAAATTSKKSTVDCSQFQQSVADSTVQLRFTTILDNGVGPNGYLRAEMSFEGLGWIGFGYSANGRMVPGYAVIGLPGLTNTALNPGKYVMDSLAVTWVSLMEKSMQTLRDSSVSSNSTHTMMKFTKRLREKGDLNINGTGSNKFMVAYGFTADSLGYHEYRSSFVFNLKPCIQGGGGLRHPTHVIRRTTVRPSRRPR